MLINVGGKQHAYQSPKDPKGLVVFLHGCARSIYGGWPPSANPRFYGMPEDVSRTKQCLKEGYAILYVSPENQKTGCFSQNGSDPVTTKSAIDQVRNTLRIQGKPLYLGGCSAGGGMIQRLVAKGFIKCDGMFNESATSADPSNQTPASLWTVLSTQKEKAEAEKKAGTLRRYRKPAAVLVSPKRKITPDFFYNQMASISLENSKRIADSLRKSGMINAAGDVVKDPKENRRWYATLGKDVKIPETRLSFWNSGIVQAMFVAWAVHDACSLYMTAFLKWAESGFKADINNLGKQFAATKPAFITL